jgi:hypothetical protein
MTEIVTELTELNDEFARAELAADAEFFRCYLADGLRFRRANGKVVGKVQFLKDLVDPDNKNERVEPRQTEILTYGEGASLCSMLILFKGTRGGKAVDGVFRNTRVFFRNGALWKCVLWFNVEAREQDKALRR